MTVSPPVDRSPVQDGLPVPRRYWAIVSIGLGITLAVLDGAIANVALPSIAQDLRASEAASIWVVNAYQIAIVVACGLMALSFLQADASSFDVIWRMAVCGAGFGFFQSPNNRAMLSEAPRERAGAAGGSLGTARVLGQSMGAVVVAFLLAAAPQSGVRHGFQIAAVTALDRKSTRLNSSH